MAVDTMLLDVTRMEVLAAAEGLSLTLEDEISGERPVPAYRLPAFHPRVRIAAVGAREEFMRVAWKALAQDYYEVIAVNALNTLAGDELSDFDPHLVLLTGIASYLFLVRRPHTAAAEREGA